MFIGDNVCQVGFVGILFTVSRHLLSINEDLRVGEDGVKDIAHMCCLIGDCWGSASCFLPHAIQVEAHFAQVGVQVALFEGERGIG